MATPLAAKLRYSLEPQPTANQVEVLFTLENQGEEPLQILKWRTPLEGVNGPIFEVQCDGKALAYQGPIVKRGPPTSSDYVTVPAKGTVAATVNLSEVYEFPPHGSCQLRFKGTVLEVRGTSAQLQTEVLRNVRVEGEPVTFKLR